MSLTDQHRAAQAKLLRAVPPISTAQALMYEVTGSWWPSLLPGCLHGLAARYFADRVRRKLARIAWALKMEAEILSRLDP